MAAFDGLADTYDLFQDWERRLPREAGHLVRILRDHGAKTVLDAACGTGAHLAALGRAGFSVAGADIAPAMIARARERLGPDTELHVAPFEEIGGRVGPRDAVLVVGNSLPNAGDEGAVRRSLASLAATVRPGGLLLLHLLNFPRITGSGGGLKPVRRVLAGGREHLFLKLFEVHPEKVVLDVIELVREGGDGPWRETLTRSVLWPVPPEWLAAELAALRLRVVSVTAGFSDLLFDPARSGDLLLTAAKPR
jgi:SAM-dependent methyltransferase